MVEINPNIFIITINVNGLILLATGFLKKFIHTLITRDTFKTQGHRKVESKRVKNGYQMLTQKLIWLN